MQRRSVCFHIQRISVVSSRPAQSQVYNKGDDFTSLWFATWCTMLHTMVAFEAPCSREHCGMPSIHNGRLHPCLHQCLKTLLFERLAFVQYLLLVAGCHYNRELVSCITQCMRMAWSVIPVRQISCRKCKEVGMSMTNPTTNSVVSVEISAASANQCLFFSRNIG